MLVADVGDKFEMLFTSFIEKSPTIGDQHNEFTGRGESGRDFRHGRVYAVCTVQLVTVQLGESERSKSQKLDGFRSK